MPYVGGGVCRVLFDCVPYSRSSSMPYVGGSAELVVLMQWPYTVWGCGLFSISIS